MIDQVLFTSDLNAIVSFVVGAFTAIAFALGSTRT